VRHLERSLSWRLSGDALVPWEADVDGRRWRVRINDYTRREPVYSLLIDGALVIEFDDWPEAWTRPSLPGEVEPRPAIDEDDPAQRHEYEYEGERYANFRHVEVPGERARPAAVPPVRWLWISRGMYRLGLDAAERTEVARTSAEAIERKGMGAYYSLSGIELDEAIAEIDRALVEAAPPREAEIESFAIADLAVTNEQFLAFCTATGRPPERTTGRKPSQPALVSFEQAAAYAEWAGARLPTGPEWERACRGDQRLLENPWMPGYDWYAASEWTTDGATCSGVEDVSRCPALRPVPSRMAAFRLARAGFLPSTTSPDRHDELLAAVYADPDSDDLRSVYADHLQECGDPRGELIALQLVQHRERGPISARERWLVENYRATWVRELHPTILIDSAEFERGFLSACYAGAVVDHVVGHPMWSTVVELRCDDSRLVTHPCMRSMRRLASQPRAIAELARAAHDVRVTELFGHRRRGRATGLPVEGHERDWMTIFEVGTLAQLRAITISTQYMAGDPFMTSLLASRLGRQLERIEIYREDDEYGLETWFEVLEHHQTLASVAFRGCDPTSEAPDGRLALVRRDGEVFARLELVTYEGHTVATLNRLPLVPIRRLEVVVPAGNEELVEMMRPFFSQFETVEVISS
jgi:uncharacterized protein (TIGR02996 family)